MIEQLSNFVIIASIITAFLIWIALLFLDEKVSSRAKKDIDMLKHIRRNYISKNGDIVEKTSTEGEKYEWK